MSHRTLIEYLLLCQFQQTTTTKDMDSFNFTSYNDTQMEDLWTNSSAVSSFSPEDMFLPRKVTGIRYIMSNVSTLQTGNGISTRSRIYLNVAIKINSTSNYMYTSLGKLNVKSMPIN